MSKKVNIESGSFQMRFNLNTNAIWTQVGLGALLAFAIALVPNPKVVRLCWIMLVLDIIALIITFLIGLKVNVEEDDGTTPSKPATTPAASVGEKKVSKTSSSKEVQGTSEKKAPLPNASALQPPTQKPSTAAAPAQAASAPAPAPEPEPVRNVNSALADAGLEDKAPEDMTDDDWAKLFNL